MRKYGIRNVSCKKNPPRNLAVAEIADRTFRLFRHLWCTTYDYIDTARWPDSGIALVSMQSMRLLSNVHHTLEFGYKRLPNMQVTHQAAAPTLVLTSRLI